MIKFLGIEYGRGATATIRNDGPALGPSAVRRMFPDANWTIVTPAPFDLEKCRADRFGENAEIQQKIYNNTPSDFHILIGGDHSVNFGHFSALADNIPTQDLCLIYIDAHLDIHTPQSSQSEASGAPHGTNVRALLGDGDKRWLALQKRTPALKSQNLFYLGTRSFEPSEIEFAKSQGIFIRTPSELQSESDWATAVAEIRNRIGNNPFVVSFDFDAIDPKYFQDVWVPEPNGLSLECAKYLTHVFRTAHGFEFVEYAPTGDKPSAKIVHDLISIVIGE